MGLNCGSGKKEGDLYVIYETSLRINQVREIINTQGKFKQVCKGGKPEEWGP